MFARKNSDELKEENKTMGKALRDMQRRRAELRDGANRAAAGAMVPNVTETSVEELQEFLRYETIRRENNALRARIAQAREGMVKEIEKLRAENAAAECEIGESMSLMLIAPTNGTEVERGNALEIKWLSTGSVAETLRIALLANNNQLIKMLSPDAARRKGSFNWLVPTDFPLGTFQVVLQDAVSGLSSQGDLGKIKIVKQP